MIDLSHHSHQRLGTYLPVVFVFLCLLALGIYYDRSNIATQRHEMRDSVLEKTSVIRARLEGNISSNTQLVRGLAVSISLEPEMSVARFIALTTPLLEEHSQLRHIAAAPDLIIKYMNPIAGNKAAIGRDFRTVADQYETVSLARDLGQLILAGPIDLMQGDRGIIARIPVFTNNAENTHKFWGIVSAVIDIDKLYAASGFGEIEESLDIAIQGKDSPGSEGELIYGDENIFASDPVFTDITLPYGSWQIGAIPKGGWEQPAEKLMMLRIGMLALALMILLPLIILSRSIQKQRESDHRLRRLFQLAPVGISLNDYSTGDFIKVNDALLAPTGYTADEFVKLSYWDITPKKYRKQEAIQLKNLKEHGRYGPYEKEFICKDGSLLSVLLNGITFHDSSGKEMIWSFVEDISKKKQAEKNLQRSQKMDAIGQLTGGIAHDFNNIIGIILGNLELLKMDLCSDADQSCPRIDTIYKAARRASNLTKKLLSFSRKQAGHQEVININHLIENMGNLIERSVTPEIEVTYQLAEDLWLCKIDPGDFDDALLNLSINARDAIKNHGHLLIKTRNVTIDKTYSGLQDHVRPGDYIELSVNDDGKGITAEQQEHIFEPFYTTKKDGLGTGLGLAMVYGFIKRSDGFIDIDTQLHVGTTIKLHLPRVAEEAHLSSSNDTQNKEKLPGGSETILVVDDEIFLLELAKELLESLGYRVITATTGKQALQQIDREPDIHLVFSDVVMPGGINGYQLAEQALKKRPNLKVLLTSGFTGKASPNNSPLLNHTEILSKPYSHHELAVRIRSALDQSNASGFL